MVSLAEEEHSNVSIHLVPLFRTLYWSVQILSSLSLHLLTSTDVSSASGVGSEFRILLVRVCSSFWSIFGVLLYSHSLFAGSGSATGGVHGRQSTSPRLDAISISFNQDTKSFTVSERHPGVSVNLSVPCFPTPTSNYSLSINSTNQPSSDLSAAPLEYSNRSTSGARNSSKAARHASSSSPRHHPYADPDGSSSRNGRSSNPSPTPIPRHQNETNLHLQPLSSTPLASTSTVPNFTSNRRIASAHRSRDRTVGSTLWRPSGRSLKRIFRELRPLFTELEAELEEGDELEEEVEAEVELEV